MLISKKVKVKISNNSIKKYNKLGYLNIKQGDEITIPIEYLTKGSAVKVDVKCDYCKKIKKISYNNYINVIKNKKIKKYSCKECNLDKLNKKKINENLISVTCCYCNNKSIIKRRKYNIKIKKYGKYSCSKCHKERYKETCLEKYGVDNTSKLQSIHKKIKKTCLEKYGNENYRNVKKKEKTNIKKYGHKCCLSNDDIRNKITKTVISKYGVENPSQNFEIFSKQQKRRFKIKKYKNTNLYYQGTYEKDFLEHYFDKINIFNIEEPIKYYFKGKNKKYFPDFYFPDKNLIIEIKSSYTFEKHKEQNLIKEEWCKKNGYNFIFIVDKNYTDFDKLIET